MAVRGPGFLAQARADCPLLGEPQTPLGSHLARQSLTPKLIKQLFLPQGPRAGASAVSWTRDSALALLLA